MTDYQTRTPAGLLFIDGWGALRHAANVAFVCLEAAMIDSPAIDSTKYQQLAVDQAGFFITCCSFRVLFIRCNLVLTKHKAISQTSYYLINIFAIDAFFFSFSIPFW